MLSYDFQLGNRMNMQDMSHMILKLRQSYEYTCKISCDFAIEESYDCIPTKII